MRRIFAATNSRAKLGRNSKRHLVTVDITAEAGHSLSQLFKRRHGVQPPAHANIQAPRNASEHEPVFGRAMLQGLH